MQNAEHAVNLNVSFRNLEPSDPLRGYAVEKLTHCVQKFANHTIEGELVLKVERERQIAELTFRFNGTDIIGAEESQDMYRSIDMLVDNISTQLRRQKERLTSHH